MIRIAIAGCGEHSRGSHAAPLARYAAQHPGELELVAACDLNIDRAQEFCRLFGFVRAYRDLDELLAAETLDGCVCVMPIEQIVGTGIKLLERHIPCVIEKPLGTSIAEAERLAAAAHQTETPHMVSVNRRFIPYLNQVRSWMNELGPVRYARAMQVRFSRNEPDFIWSTGIHVMDALRYLMGDIENFAVNTQQSSADSVVWYLVSLRFKSGATGQVEILPTSGMVEETYEFFGDRFRGRVTAGSGPQRSLECWRDNRLVLESRANEEEPEDLRNGAYQEVEEFVSALRTGSRPQPEIKDVLPSARICFAIADLLSTKA